MTVATGPVTVDPTLARDARFRMPVVITRAAWDEAVTWTDRDTDETGALQDEAGRLMDVLRMAAVAVRAIERAAARAGQRDVIETLFTVHRIPRGVPYLGDDDDGDGSYEALTVASMYVIVGGTPATVTISLDDE
jgi:hypothetical protein